MELPDDLQEWVSDPRKLAELLQQLVAENALLREQNAVLVAENQRLQARVTHLEAANFKLTKLAFGPRTERRPLPSSQDLQGWLFQQERELLAQRVEEQLDVTQVVPEHPRRKPRRRPGFPKNLPREKTICELTPEERRCACGAELQEMGTAEVSEVLERIEYTCVHEIHRKKYCCRGCQSGVLVARGPTRVLEKSLLGNSFAAHVLVERFQFHMPYHRQEKKYQSEGLRVSRSVLCESAARCAELLEPVHEALKAEVLSATYLKADETTCVLQTASDGGKRTAYFWAYLAPQSGVIFDFTESRSRDGPTEMLLDFRGYLQSDGYAGYNETSERPLVIRVGCWAHVRRKFDESKRSDPEFAEEALRQIDALYVLDRVSRGASIEERLAHRARTMTEGVHQFREWLELRQTQVLEQGELGKAIRYALGQWTSLTRFLEDGRIDLDNNTVEQMLRHVAVGRKNWTIIGSPEGGDRAAIFYSLIQTCRLLDINPRTYLRDILVRAKEGEDPRLLTPRQWSLARTQPAVVIHPR